MTSGNDEPGRIRLSVWSTPIEPAPRLARAIGLAWPSGANRRG